MKKNVLLGAPLHCEAIKMKNLQVEFVDGGLIDSHILKLFLKNELLNGQKKTAIFSFFDKMLIKSLIKSEFSIIAFFITYFCRDTFVLSSPISEKQKNPLAMSTFLLLYNSLVAA